MSNIVVVYHSGYGHTQRVAQSICAQVAGAELVTIDAESNVDKRAGPRSTPPIPSSPLPTHGHRELAVQKWADAL